MYHKTQGPPVLAGITKMPSFDSLPDEVLRVILSFMDISSLASLSMTKRAEGCRLSSLASDDVTWYSLVQQRFGIGRTDHRQHASRQEGVVLVRRHSSSSLSDASSVASRKKRPMTYGGSTWKEAYRSLSSTMRIPETRLTGSSAPVFAAPSSRRRFVTGGGRPVSRRVRAATVNDSLGVWCMLNHAENCRTKTVSRRLHRGGVTNGSSLFVYNPDRRYLEVKLCLQNTKSGFGCIAIPDILGIRFVTINEEECCTSWGCRGNRCDRCITSFPIVEHGPWAPKILLRKKFSQDNNPNVSSAHNLKEMETAANGIVLRPFEIVVLSIHLSCSPDMVYETDVLSTLSSIRVPVVPHTGWEQQSIKRNRDRAALGVALAHFLPEDLLWDYYCQLPGGCLSLIDRSRLIPN
ncbi:hypothetical protein HJC23_001886 [Cyclotella cryptica]|uniref:F-box domain-containing protein n=1 Tax=Cyclotella cryptica TaxID=29204 RepID=A0ABD3PLP4_9STRA|eukprot:CCRYP_013681-RA/>CCRYP_013681-RA protein AED:0.00 eAED:0.00 QI:366/-1/1/1/-1/1/1/149/406